MGYGVFGHQQCLGALLSGRVVKKSQSTAPTVPKGSFLAISRPPLYKTGTRHVRARY